MTYCTPQFQMRDFGDGVRIMFFLWLWSMDGISPARRTRLFSKKEEDSKAA